MLFLLRMAFWLGLVLLLLPSGGGQRGASPHEVGAGDAISPVATAVHDLRGLCAREPNPCTAGTQFAADMGRRARAAVRMLHDLLVGEPARQQGASSRSPSARGRAAPPSQNTLTPSDLTPAWRGRPLRGGAGHPA